MGSDERAIREVHPIATILTGAKRHDATQLIPLIETIVPIGGARSAAEPSRLCLRGPRLRS